MLAPASAARPGGHVVQLVAAAAAATDPAAHRSHDMAPCAPLARPGAQSTQRLLSPPRVPAGHMPQLVAPSADSAPEPQGEQRAEPLDGAKNPGAHGAHCGSPMPAALPARHVVQRDAPVPVAVVPSGHAAQLVLAGSGAWRPGSHDWQSAALVAPAPATKRPTGHALHADPSEPAASW